MLEMGLHRAGRGVHTGAGLFFTFRDYGLPLTVVKAGLIHPKVLHITILVRIGKPHPVTPREVDGVGFRDTFSVVDGVCVGLSEGDRPGLSCHFCFFLCHKFIQ